MIGVNTLQIAEMFDTFQSLHANMETIVDSQVIVLAHRINVTSITYICESSYKMWFTTP